MNEKKSNGQTLPKMEVKNGNNTTAPVKAETAGKQAPKLSYDELLKRLEELEKRQSKKPANIDEMIRFFELKKAKINELEEFKTHRKNLEVSKEQTEKAIANKDFEGETYRMTFESDVNYNSKALFRISNPEIIRDCASFLIMRVDAKIQLLEKEIQQDF